MRKVSKILLVAILFLGFSGCVEDSYEEIHDDSIMIPASTDPDDGDEDGPVPVNPKVTNN